MIWLLVVGQHRYGEINEICRFQRYTFHIKRPISESRNQGSRTTSPLHWTGHTLIPSHHRAREICRAQVCFLAGLGSSKGRIWCTIYSLPVTKDRLQGVAYKYCTHRNPDALSSLTSRRLVSPARPILPAFRHAYECNEHEALASTPPNQ